MSTLRAGYGKCDVTPSLGCFLQGNPTRREVEWIHDPLYARCVAFENDGLAVLMYVDFCGIHQALADPIRQFVAESLNIFATNVFVAATHTHTGPNIGNAAFPIDKAYVESLKHFAARAARSAVNDLHPAQMYFNNDVLPNMTFVRRFRMKDGSVLTNPGSGNPDILCPMSEADDTIRLLKITREGAGDIVLVNFQCHADVVKQIEGKFAISADYPGAVCKVLEDAIPGSDCIYCNGTAGDLVQGNQMVVSDWNTRCWEHAVHMGRTIGGKILSMYSQAKPIEAGPVRAIEKRIDIPLKEPTEEEIVRSQQVVDDYESGKFVLRKKAPGVMLDITKLYEAKALLGLAKGAITPNVCVSAFSVGDFAVAGIPGEPFCEIGKRIRAGSTFPAQFTLGLTNGSQGYYPMMDAFDVQGYEARTSRFKAGVGELLADTALELVTKLANWEA